MANPKPNLLQDDIAKSLARLALPMMISIVITLLTGIIDTFFLGRIGPKELAVMSFTFPVITLVMSIAFGLNVGATAAISRALGSGDQTVVRRLTTHAMFLAVVIVALLSAIGLVLQGPLFRALGAEESLLPSLASYMNIWFLGVVSLVVPMVGNGAMQATGDPKTPAKIMAFAAFLNLVLDPILIFGVGPIPALGLRGAALSWVSARTITMLISLWFLGSRLKLLDLHIPTAKELWSSWKTILGVGLPAAISNALVPISVAILTGFIAGFGRDSIAAYGLGSRIDGLLLIPAMSFGLALTPFIGQNWGAHRVDRVSDALAFCRRVSLLWGALVWVLLLFLRGPMASLFSSDPEVLALTKEYLLVIPLAYGATGVVTVTSATFNAVDRALRSTLLSATRSLLLAVPLAWLGGQIAKELGLFSGIALATLLSAALAAFWSRSILAPKDATPITKVSEAIRGGSLEMQTALDSFLKSSAAVKDVIASARPINTIGFYFKGRELGHVHRNGHIDLHVPAQVHDQLLNEGRAFHHRHQHDTSWISHNLLKLGDVNEAVWLLRLTATIARIGNVRGRIDEIAEKELEELALTPQMKEAIQQSFIG